MSKILTENDWPRTNKACLPRARPFSLSPTTSKRLLRRLFQIWKRNIQEILKGGEVMEYCAKFCSWGLYISAPSIVNRIKDHKMKGNVRIKTRKGHNWLFSHRWLRGRGREEGFKFSAYFVQDILGDLGAISRAGRKSATKVFKHDRMSPWVPTLTGTISKRLGKCWPLIGQKKCFVSSYPIGEQHLLSSYRTAIVSPNVSVFLGLDRFSYLEIKSVLNWFNSLSCTEGSYLNVWSREYGHLPQNQILEPIIK